MMNAAPDGDPTARSERETDRLGVFPTGGFRRRRRAVPATGGLAYRHRWASDLVICVLVTVAATIALADVEAFEFLYDYTRDHEDWDLDEIILGVMVLAFTSSGYAWRRWREARTHLKARAEMEHELRSSAEDMNFLISAAKGAFYTCEAGGNCAMSYVSPSIEAHTGHKADFFVNDPAFWGDNIHLDDRDQAFPDSNRLLQDNLESCEYRVRHADGSYRWISDQRRLKRDADGNPDYIVGMRTDITAQKESERELEAAVEAATAELREREERYRSLYNKTPAMLQSIDAEGRLLSVSDFWLEKLGYQRDEVIGEDSTGLLTPESARQAADVILPELWRTGVCKDAGLQIVTKSGDVLDILVSAIPMRNESGTITRALAVLTDVTERKIVERKLVQAQKMESVGQLTGGLAHDFNNLLGVVLGNLELIEHSMQGDEKTARRIQTARAAVDRGAELTQRLLAFSRRQRLETKAIAPNALIAGLVDLLKRTLGESIVLDCRLGDGVPRVRSDAAQLESALLNLAVNARDAMPDGGTLVIESTVVHLDDDYAARESDVVPGDYVAVSVTDTGVGIAAETLPKVFEPFFTTKEVGKGSGLGLSMVYGFMKQSGGHVRIYSEVGRGTTVRMYLPVDMGDARVEAVPSVPAAKDLGGRETVLVVEDQADVREVAVALLEDLGYAVFEATDGQQALGVLSERPEVDLLFTDIVMPGGMDGTDLAKKARSLRPYLPVVFASGYAEASVLREGELTIAGGIVTKPYRRTDLAAKIRQALDGQQAARARSA